MDEGIALIVLLVLVVFGGSVAGIVALLQLSSLKREVATLKVKLNAADTPNLKVNPLAQSDKSNVKHKESAQLNPQPDVYSAKRPSDTVAVKAAAVSAATIATKKPALSPPKTDFFTPLFAQFKANWLTWVGAVALAFGGIFLARYSLEAGLLSETMRLTLGAIFGISLIVVAETLHRKGIVFEGFNNYIPAALASGGFISCFALALLAYSHYGLVQALPAFTILTLLSLAASWMALRFGPMLALIGILGAYSVPVWVNTGSNDFIALLTYVGFVSVSASLVAHYVKRQWLWYLLWTGHLGWYFLVALTAAQDIHWFINFYALFSIGLLIAVPRLGLTLKQIEHRPHHFKTLLKQLPDNLLLLVIVVPLYLLLVTYNDLITWQLSMLSLVALLLFLVLKNSAWDHWLFIALLSVVCLLTGQYSSVDYSEQLFVFRQNYGVGLFFIAMFLGYGLLFSRKYPKRLGFTLLASLSSFVIIGCLYVIIPDEALMTAYPLWCTVLLAVSAWLFKLVPQANRPIQGLCYWLGANANISLALTMLLQGSSLTLALAIQVYLISWYTNHKQISIATWPLKALVALLLFRLSVAPWSSNYDDLSLFGVHWSLIVYPICTGIFYMAGKLWQDTKVRVWLEGTALHCIALLITMQTSYQLVGHAPQFGELSAYEHILLTCNWGILGCVYLFRMTHSSSMEKLYLVVGGGLILLTVLCAIQHLTTLNPLFMPIRVGEWLFINWLVLIWLLPAGIFVTANYLLKPLYTGHSKLLTTLINYTVHLVAAGLVALYISAEIRHFWQGPVIQLWQPTTDAELYSYSLAWLLIGATVVVISHLKQWQGVQKVGLSILAIVICKVFLIDMANLTGLLKALSFIGLGLSLVALGWLFQKFKAKPTALP